ncbi:MAG: GNAT family N-acetyltransferase [Nitrososphaerales archaeon]
MKTKKEVIVRTANPTDIDAIVELQKKSFPHLAKIDVVWKPKHLKKQIHIFPEGQFCAVYDNEIVGSASSLIVDLGDDPHRYHTWKEITGGSFFDNHNPSGDSLYGADVSVHPKYRRLRIATKIYNARKVLVKKLSLRRIIAGGRLYNYCEYASQMSADKYALKVVKGEFTDPVLSFQLKTGFKLIKVMPNYMRDPRSLNYATFIEWLNPDYKSKGK